MEMGQQNDLNITKTTQVTISTVQNNCCFGRAILLKKIIQQHNRRNQKNKCRNCGQALQPNYKQNFCTSKKSAKVWNP